MSRKELRPERVQEEKEKGKPLPWQRKFFDFTFIFLDPIIGIQSFRVEGGKQGSNEAESTEDNVRDAVGVINLFSLWRDCKC